MSDNLQKLTEAGVSIWLDDLSRERIETGNLAELAKNDHVVGVTTNPSIFAAALSEGERYDDQVRELAAQDKDVDEVVFALTTSDVRNACDVIREVYDATNGVDGRVSIEVDPRMAHDTDATNASAKALWAEVDRPNLFIKIPATTEGAPAITTALAEGISVNVTLIFGLDRYQSVMEAYVSGLEQARTNGKDLSQIHSVASFFVSRVDTEIDKRLTNSAAPDDLRARPASPTPDSPTRPMRSSSPATAGTRSRPTAPTVSAHCGRPRASRTRTTGTPCTSTTWSSRTPSTRCRRRPSTRSATTARSGATRCGPTTTTPSR